VRVQFGHLTGPTGASSRTNIRFYFIGAVFSAVEHIVLDMGTLVFVGPRGPNGSRLRSRSRPPATMLARNFAWAACLLFPLQVQRSAPFYKFNARQLLRVLLCMSRRVDGPLSPMYFFNNFISFVRHWYLGLPVS
jgi:hypothetical protein